MSILKEEKRALESTKSQIRHIQELDFNHAIEFIIEHIELVKVPIIFDETKLLIGYNKEVIRQFIPQNYRKLYKEENLL